MRAGLRLSAFVLAWLLPAAASAQTQHHHFTITTLNKGASTPIAGVRLVTTNGIEVVTDAAGKARFYEPGLMGEAVFFKLGQCLQRTCTGGSGAATACTTDADCNLGFNPPLAFLGIPGAPLTATEQGNATVRLCPADAGTCTPDVVLAANAPSPLPLSTQRFKLKVVDAATGRGVPRMRVTTPSQTYVTDSAGVIAFYGAAAMGTTVRFAAAGNGYGSATVDLLAAAGGSGELPVPRIDLAERLYRITGGGIYNATALLELPAPTAAPLLNARVFGQDTAQTAVYQGRVFWLWGDTSKPAFPLGNFRVTGATSQLPDAGGLDPSVGVDLTYFGDGAGFVAPLCPAANFPPPVAGQNLLCWMFDLVTAPAASGAERLFARYTLIGGGGFELKETGLGRFNDTTRAFDKLVTWPSTQKVQLLGHPLKITHGQTTYAYYVDRAFSSTSTGYKAVDRLARVVANEASLADPATYEAYTPLVQGSDTLLDTQPDGSLRYAWKRGTRALSGDLKEPDAAVPAGQKLYGHLKDPDSQAALNSLTESVAYNAYRDRYVAVILEIFGASLLGELWFAEADTPMGPWVYARKIVTHREDGYTFYNPRLHGFFDKRGGREIYFEATYTTFLSSAKATPRDDYNQVMERLDLDTPGVVLPVPVYDLSQATLPGTFVTKRGLRPATRDSAAPFMAPDRSGFAGTVPVYWSDAECRSRQLVVGGDPTTPPLFHALLPTAPNPPATTVPLYHYVDAAAARHAYSVEPAAELPGFVREDAPIARVWANPVRVELPVSEYLAPLLAEAGADQCPTESAPGAGASVALDGSQSVTPAGAITYAWTFPGGTAQGKTANVTLPVGLHVVSLQATAADGQTSTDTALIHVAPYQAPTAPGGCGCALTASGQGGATGALLLLGLIARAGRRRRG